MGTRIYKFNEKRCFTRWEMQKFRFDLGVTKLTVNVIKTWFSGYKTESILAKEYNTRLDYADLFNLVAIICEGSEKSDVEVFVNALENIFQKSRGTRCRAGSCALSFRYSGCGFRPG
jgi:hypothetical protein